MVQLDDLDIEIITEDLRRLFEQLEAGVDPDAHVRRQHHRDLFSVLLSVGALLGSETGRAADHHLAELGADREVFQGDIGEGEVDQQIGAGQGRGQIITDFHAEFASPGNQSGVHAELRMAGTLHGAGQFQPFSFKDGVNQASAHTSGGADNCDVHKSFLYA